jgi:hypothetical protein
MKTRRALVFVCTACLVAACGARTGLLTPTRQDAGGLDANEEADVVEEADAFDATEEPDAVEEDAFEEPDAVEEDAFFPPDGPDICPDAGSTVIYAITTESELVSFYPPTATFTDIGKVTCPVTVPDDEPFSMAVSRAGVAYIEYQTSGDIFRVSTRTAECGPTTFVPTNNNFPLNFGMGFSADIGDAGLGSEAGETLYLSGDPLDMATGTFGNAILATLDTNTFITHPIGTVVPVIQGSELTGTSNGELFGFYPTSGGTGPAAIGQIDKTSAQLLSSVSLPTIDIMSGWAFGFWGGDFYTFTAPDMTDTVVQRYRPSDGTVVQVAFLPNLVVDGVGVSTCAPSM